MPQLTATRELRYGGKTLLEGDSFEATDKDARTLIAIKKAEAAGSSPKNKTDLPKEVMKPAKVEKVEEEAPSEPVVPLSTQNYMRRDMRATDGPTGEETSVPSSRRGRQPRKPTSDD